MISTQPSASQTLVTPTLAGQTLGRQPYWRQIVRRVLQEPTTIIGLVLVLLFVVAAITAPLISPYDPLFQNISASLTPPSRDYLLGTDKLGRDMLSRMIYGSRISIGVGFAVVVMAGLFG